jgi:basic membrane protein A
VNGEFAGGEVTTFGLAEDGVGLGETSPDAPADAVEQTKAQIDKIVAGEVQIPDTVGR